MKFKRTLSLLASVAMTVTAVTGAMSLSVVNAADDATYKTSGTCGEKASWIINSDSALIISGEGEVTQTEDGAISGKVWGWEKLRSGITEIIVEDGITKAGKSSFCGDSTDYFSVIKVTFPPSLTSLNGCLDRNSYDYHILEDIYVYSKNITDASTMYNSDTDGKIYSWHGSGIKWHVFKGSETENSLRNDLKLTDEDIEYLEDDAEMPAVENHEAAVLEPVSNNSGPAGVGSKYKWDEASKTLTFSGKGVISIHDDYYEKYKEKTEHVVIDSGIIGIVAVVGVSNGITCGAFDEYTALKDVKLPDTLIKIGDGTFEGSALEGELNIPASVKYIGECAFQNINITSINSLNEGMRIEGSAFRNCKSLKEVTIPKNVILGSSGSPNGSSDSCSTFSGCSSIEKVIIEEGIIDSLNHGFRSMFGDCALLKDAYLFADFQGYIWGPNNKPAGDSAFSNCDNLKFHIYKDSVTEKALRDVGYLKDATEETEANYVYMADTTALETAISDAESIETEKYTDESASAFTEALESAKAVLKNLDATQDEVDSAVKAINDAKNALEEKKAEPSESDPTDPSDSSDPTSPSKPSNPTNPTGGNVKKTTSPAQKASEAKAAAEKAIKQAKIVSLTAKAKGKKKITVSWKKVAKAVGYEVQASTKKNFKKDAIKKTTTKNKLVIKKLKSKKKYFVRVRAYTTYKDAKGKTQKVYGKWFKSKKKVKVK